MKYHRKQHNAERIKYNIYVALRTLLLCSANESGLWDYEWSIYSISSDPSNFESDQQFVVLFVYFSDNVDNIFMNYLNYDKSFQEIASFIRI